MADGNTGKQHQNPKALLKFLRTQPASYVKETAEWIKEEFPGSAEAMLPEMRLIYAERRRVEKANS